jgi:hypothetical protein
VLAVAAGVVIIMRGGSAPAATSRAGGFVGSTFASDHRRGELVGFRDGSHYSERMPSDRWSSLGEPRWRYLGEPRRLLGKWPTQRVF